MTTRFRIELAQGETTWTWSVVALYDQDGWHCTREVSAGLATTRALAFQAADAAVFARQTKQISVTL